LSLTLDGLVERDTPANTVREILLVFITTFGEIFPNWGDAVDFSGSYFGDKRDAANAHIHALGGFSL
jgi:hypothetical protein